jgi:hypothetical protein
MDPTLEKEEEDEEVFRRYIDNMYWNELFWDWVHWQAFVFAVLIFGLH